MAENQPCIERSRRPATKAPNRMRSGAFTTPGPRAGCDQRVLKAMASASFRGVVLVIVALLNPTMVLAGTGPTLTQLETPGAAVPGLQPLDPYSSEARVDPRTFEMAAADLAAERQMLWVRELLGRHGSKGEVRAALDRIAAWEAKVEPLRAAAQNAHAVDAAARAAPRDFYALRRRAEFWVHVLEGEREAILDKTDPRARTIFGDQVRLDTNTGMWVYPTMLVEPPAYGQSAVLRLKSEAFPAARDAVAALLAVAPRNAEALYLDFTLYRFSNQPITGVENRAAQLSGPYGAAVRAYMLTHDGRVGAMRARADQLRFGTTMYRTMISRGVLTPVPKGRLMSVPVHIPPSPQALAEAGRLEAAANRLQAEQTRLLNATVADAPGSEPMFRILSELGTPLPNDVVRDRLLRDAMTLRPGDWHLYENYAELASGHSDMKQKERAADAAQRLLLWQQFKYPLYLVNEQARFGFGYFTYNLARRAVRRNPVGCPENAVLAQTMEPIAFDTYDGAPVIPDGARQTVLQWELVEAVCAREVHHPDEWRGWTKGKIEAQIAAARREIARIARANGVRP